MVGKNAKGVERKTPFWKIIQRYNGKSFLSGGQGPDAYDCLGLILAILRELDKIGEIKIFDGYTIDNYHLFYQGDKDAADRELVKFYEQFGDHIEVYEKVAGDPIIVESKSGRLFPAIYVGNGNFIAAFTDVGVRVFPLKDTLMKCVKARRL